METNHSLMTETLPLLREVSRELRTTSQTGLAEKVDEAIDKLEGSMRSGHTDQRLVREIMKTVGQGIALIPEIEQLFKMFKD